MSFYQNGPLSRQGILSYPQFPDTLDIPHTQQVNHLPRGQKCQEPGETAKSHGGSALLFGCLDFENEICFVITTREDIFGNKQMQ